MKPHRASSAGEQCPDSPVTLSGPGNGMPKPDNQQGARALHRAFLGLTAEVRNGALRPLQCAFILEFGMNDVVELILKTYQSMCPLDTERAADSRQKISRYIETLASAGQRDDEQLTIYGLAYLTELHEGQDPRFTGC
jgi:hypothetical protein